MAPGHILLFVAVIFIYGRTSNTTGSSAARNLPSISRFVQRRQSTPGVLTVVKKSCFVLFVCV